jgi:hypothetical protein
VSRGQRFFFAVPDSARVSSTVDLLVGVPRLCEQFSTDPEFLDSHKAIGRVSKCSLLTILHSETWPRPITRNECGAEQEPIIGLVSAGGVVVRIGPGRVSAGYRVPHPSLLAKGGEKPREGW